MSQFRFAEVTQEFDAHIAAHLPGYEDVQHLVAVIAEYCVPEPGRIVDIGCSTGTSLRRIHDYMPKRRIEYIGYDVEPDMLNQAVDRCAGMDAKFLLADVTNGQSMFHSSADLSLLLWTLQFLRPEERTPLLTRLRMRAARSGVVVIAAKSRLTDSRWEEIAVAALDEYKEAHGVSAQQRVDKTRGLRGVLMAESAEDTAQRLRDAGWHSPTLLFRWHVWSVIAAYAEPGSATEEVLL